MGVNPSQYKTHCVDKSGCECKISCTIIWHFPRYCVILHSKRIYELKTIVNETCKDFLAIYLARRPLEAAQATNYSHFTQRYELKNWFCVWGVSSARLART